MKRSPQHKIIHFNVNRKQKHVNWTWKKLEQSIKWGCKGHSGQSSFSYLHQIHTCSFLPHRLGISRHHAPLLSRLPQTASVTKLRHQRVITSHSPQICGTQTSVDGNLQNIRPITSEIHLITTQNVMYILNELWKGLLDNRQFILSFDQCFSTQCLRENALQKNTHSE